LVLTNLQLVKKDFLLVTQLVLTPAMLAMFVTHNSLLLLIDSSVCLLMGLEATACSMLSSGEGLVLSVSKTYWLIRLSL